MRQTYFRLLYASIFGFFTLFLVAGLAPLNPQNIAWLSNFDPTQHYVGWALFSKDEWRWPLGLNPLYGLEISNSIVFSDSIPLLALLFKLGAPFLTEPFQYFGLWILLCLTLQFYFGSLLGRLITPYLWLQYLIGALLVFSPPLLWRIGLHAGLVSHFLILIGFYLVLRPTSNRQIWYWSILLMVTLLSHFYFFPIIVTLWLADLGNRFWLAHTISWSLLLWNITIGLGACLLIAYLAGYFAINGGSVAGAGFSIGGFNLLTLFDSAGWSYLLSPVVLPPNPYDRFNYLGLGNIVLIVIASACLIKQRNLLLQPIKRYPFLLIGLVVLSIFSLSNRIAIGNWSMEFAIPEQLYFLASIIRTPNRLIWASFYAIVIFSLYVLIRSYSNKKSLLIISLILTLQIIDTSAGWLNIKQSLARWSSPEPNQVVLKNPFWEAAARHYSQIKIVPLQLGQYQVFWHTFAPYAAEYHLGTNAVFLARPADPSQVASTNLAFTKASQVPPFGNYDPTTLYIFDDWKNNPDLGIPKFNPHSDLLVKIDGYTVLAPGWKNCATCPAVPSQFELSSIVEIPKLNKPIRFIKESNAWTNYHVLGLDHPEPWGAWSIASTVTFVFPIPQEKVSALELIMNALINPKQPQQRVEIWIDKQLKQEVTLTQANDNIITIPITPMPNQSYIFVELRLPDKIRPLDLGINQDTRTLAIGMISAQWKQ